MAVQAADLDLDAVDETGATTNQGGVMHGDQDTHENIMVLDWKDKTFSLVMYIQVSFVENKYM